jgi:putative sigma-54 modulation protein
MQINITFRNMEPSGTLREYAEGKISRVKKLIDEPIEAHIVLKVEKFRHIAEVSIDANGMRVNGAEETGDMYSAIDMVADKIESQLRKFKDKPRRRKNSESARSLDGGMEVAAGDLDEDRLPRIIRSEPLLAKPMDVDEALLELEDSERAFLVFTNRRSNRLNVLYRRPDGHYGLIEPLQ